MSLLLYLRMVHFLSKKSIYSHFMILFFETLNYCLWSIERDLFRWKDFSPSKALVSLVIFVSSLHLSFLMYFEKCIIFNQRIHSISKRFNNKIYTLNSRERKKGKLLQRSQFICSCLAFICYNLANHLANDSSMGIFLSCHGNIFKKQFLLH